MKPLAFVSLVSLAASGPLVHANLIHFDLAGLGGSGLLPANELSLANASSGSGGEIGGGIFLDTDTNLLTINVGWGSGNGFTDLNATATAALIHGPADMSSAAGVVSAGTAFNFGSLSSNFTFDTSATGGSITGSIDLDDLSLGTTDLLAGMWYLNVHTSSNPGGEIRGNLVAVPEGSTLAFLAGLVALTPCFCRRRGHR